MVRVLFLFLTRFHVNVARSNGNPTFVKSSRSAIALSLHNNKKSFSSAVDHVFRFSFVGVLILLERRNK